jgi:membrane-associated protein
MSLTESITGFLANSGALVAYIVYFTIVFAESGILIGFFLPGDSLLLALGVLASKDILSLPLLLIIGSIAAITGDQVGYAFGRRVGPALFDQEDSRFFKKKNLKKAHDFYEKYGTKTIVIARFVPFARTFAPILAGIAKMHYPTFLRYNIIGGIGWVFSVTLLGYFLGELIPDIEQYIFYIIGFIILLSVFPAYFEWRKHRKEKDYKEL